MQVEIEARIENAEYKKITDERLPMMFGITDIAAFVKKGEKLSSEKLDQGKSV